MGKAITYTLRGIQTVLAVCTLGLSAYVINWYLTWTRFSPPHIFNFHLVTPILSILSIAYLSLAPVLAPRALHAFAALALETLNTIFYFSGFVALAVFLSELAFCNGPQCAAGQALVGVSAASFVVWAVSMGLVMKDCFKGGLRAESTVGSWGNRAPAPGPRVSPMSQA